jgi:hypothetical protein
LGRVGDHLTYKKRQVYCFEACTRTKLMELLGYRNKTQMTKYRDILIAAKILKKGNYYRKGKASRPYMLSKEVMGLLDNSRLRKEVVA